MRRVQLHCIDLASDIVLAELDEPIRESPELEASLPDLIRSVRANGLEGLVVERRDSRYERGQRSGAWQKMRVNRRQTFVIGGYTTATRSFHAIVFGYHRRERIEAAVVAGGRHATGPHEAWMAANPFNGGFRAHHWAAWI